MKRSLAAVAVALATVAAAQTAPVALTFTAVDAITVDHDELAIAGVLLGEATPVTRSVSFAGFGTTYSGTAFVPYEQRQACERLALAAMGRPGYYVFTITLGRTSGYPSCTLARATP